jgi:DNA-binding CsgD family transcriptional regulator
LFVALFRRSAHRPAAVLKPVLRIERSSGQPLEALVTPVTRRGPLRSSKAQAIALLLVADPDAMLATGDTALRALYGLTPAEARVAIELANGRSTDEIASVLALTRETIRTYVKRVLSKTACRRRSELMRLLSPLSPRTLARRVPDEDRSKGRPGEPERRRAARVPGGN